jgi:O-antigen/teichoic acid export membrane protein
MTSNPLSGAAVTGRLSKGVRLLVDRASWTLIDQGIVSLGGFLINVELARFLTGADYGTFALFMGVVFIFRSVDFSVISYPLSLRLCETPRERHPTLFGTTAVLAAGLTIFFALALALGTVLLGRSDIVVAVTACYLSWQAQETTRRFLTAEFRYRAAVWGDATSFLGQAAVVAMLASIDALTLHSALYAITAMFLAGTIVHVFKLQFGQPDFAQIRELALRYFELGKWSVLTYEVVLLRTQLFPWILAAMAGTAATASFQAAVNIANLMNPIILGIGTVIPQAAAQARLAGGLSSAWRVARGYILFGLPPIIIFCAFGLLAPQFALRIVYGANSPYLEVSLCVQLLVLAWACEYVGEMIAKTMLGIEMGGLAFLTNTTGVIAAFAALPLVFLMGVFGACLALAIANSIRLICAWLILRWILAKERLDTPTRIAANSASMS